MGGSRSFGWSYCAGVVYGIKWQDRFVARFYQEVSGNTTARIEIGKRQNEE